jgi:hypothetical protein
MTAIGSGFHVTWTAILLAWKGFPDVITPVTNLINTDEVLNFALDRIGYGPPEEEDVITRLAFSDGTDTWKIHRCLEELASIAPEDVQRALQVWRWVLLYAIVTEWELHAAMGEFNLIRRYGTLAAVWQLRINKGSHDD